MSAFIDITSGLFLLAGALCCLTGGIGLLRMPDFFTRIHAASIIDTLGVALILIGLMLQAGWTLVLVKLLAIAVLIFISSPAASHALARAALLRGIRPHLSERKEPPSKP